MGKPEENKTAALALVNEGIRQVAQASIGADLTWEFFCECGAPDCETTVELTLADYTAIHDGGEVVLASGHQLDRRERTTPGRGRQAARGPRRAAGQARAPERPAPSN